ncbi:MAG: SPW repeat domain-containing protein [Gammaproteobacteria bacterium]
MNKLSIEQHGYLDFVTVAVFLVAPSLFGLTSVAAMLAYLLAAVHLVMTLATDFPFGVVKIIPFSVHGWVERIVGPVLILVPFVLGFSEQTPARNFYIGIGIVIIIVGFLTDYSSPGRDERSQGGKTLPDRTD